MATLLGEAVIAVRLDTKAVRSQLASLRGQMAATSGAMAGTAGAAGAAAMARGGGLGMWASAASSKMLSLSSSLNKAGKAMYSTGRAMTWRISVPLALLGGLSVKAANTFEMAFARIEGIAGKIGVPIDEAKQKVKELAVEFGRDPQELAEGLYFIASAGIKASDVMSVLRESARGAAAQLADTQTLAQMLTTVMNNYGESGMTAAAALDILTGAIKLGKAEPQELANSLGPVIPMASQLGVSFASMAGAIAQGTNAGLSAARAATGLRFILGSLQRPTASAKTVLKDYGLTVEDLQGKFKELGATGGIQYLSDLFDTTTTKGKEAFAVVMGGQRGLIIANALIGENLANAKRIDEQMKRVVGSGIAESALEKTKQTNAQRFKELKAQWKVFMIDLGDEIVPILLNDVLPAIKAILDAFKQLGDETKRKVIVGGILIALMGPALQLLGILGRIIAGLVWTGGRGVLLLAGSAGAAAAGGTAGAASAAATAGAASAAAGGTAAASILTPVLIATIVAAVAIYLKGKRDDKVNNEFSDPTRSGVPQSGRPNPDWVQALETSGILLGRIVGWIYGSEDRWRRSRDQIAADFNYVGDATEEWVKKQVKRNYMTDQEAEAFAGAVSSFESMKFDLDKVQGVGGTTRRELLEAALAAGDVRGALELMRQWLLTAVEGLQRLYTTTAGLQASGKSMPSGIGGQVINPGSRGGEHGLITGLEGGGFLVTRPTFIRGNVLTGEKRKKEAVIPLEDVRGKRILAGALSEAMGGSVGSTVVVNVAGKVERPEDIRREMDWWMRSRGL